MFHCLVIKVVYLSLSVQQLIYITTSIFVCQQLFLISLKKLLKFFKTFLMKFFVFIDDLSTLPQVESFVNHFFDFLNLKF